MKNRDLFKIIEPSSGKNPKSTVYDILILSAVFMGVLPLFFKEDSVFFYIIETISTAVFIIDYILRFKTADEKLKKGKLSYVLYPVTPAAIIDLLSIIPYFGLLSPTFFLLRLLRLFKIFRIFKGLKYSKNFQIIKNVFLNNKRLLLSLFFVVAAYIIITALIMFNIEPNSFENYFDAVYWATTALTTVGYGDIYPVTAAGKVVSMLSSIFGVAMIALPAGVITAGFMTELSKQQKTDSPAE